MKIDREKWIRLGKSTENWLLKLPIESKKQALHGDKMIRALKDIRKEYLNDEKQRKNRKKGSKNQCKIRYDARAH